MATRTSPIETVGVGDIINMSWRDGDVVRMARGKIANIEMYGRTRVLIAESGKEIGRYNLDNLKQTVCEIVERHVPRAPQLFDGWNAGVFHGN